MRGWPPRVPEARVAGASGSGLVTVPVATETVRLAHIALVPTALAHRMSSSLIQAHVDSAWN